jgi:hypothetical protein
MKVAGIGLTLFFVSNQAILLIYGLYPPFGIITVSMLGLAAYFLLTGIYATSISVAQDLNLVKSIEKIGKSAFFTKLGYAERQKVLVDKAKNLMLFNKTIQHESGVPSSLEDEDIMSYVTEVTKLKSKT